MLLVNIINLEKIMKIIVLQKYKINHKEQDYLEQELLKLKNGSKETINNSNLNQHQLDKILIKVSFFYLKNKFYDIIDT